MKYQTWLGLNNPVTLSHVSRSLITTLHQPPSQLLSWVSQWRPHRPTTTPRSPPEPPRSPACRFVSNKDAVSWILHSDAQSEKDMMLCWCACVTQLLQQLPAERVEQKEIPAEHMILKSTFDSLVQRCQLAAGDPVSGFIFIFIIILRSVETNFY